MNERDRRFNAFKLRYCKNYISMSEFLLLTICDGDNMRYLAYAEWRHTSYFWTGSEWPWDLGDKKNCIYSSQVIQEVEGKTNKLLWSFLVKVSLVTYVCIYINHEETIYNPRLHTCLSLSRSWLFKTVSH